MCIYVAVTFDPYSTNHVHDMHNSKLSGYGYSTVIQWLNLIDFITDTVADSIFLDLHLLESGHLALNYSMMY